MCIFKYLSLCICYFGIIICFTSCSVFNRGIVHNELKDSIIVKIYEKQKIIKDTVYLQIPKIEQIKEVKDTISVIDNEIASSRAEVKTDGTLIHSLNVKPQKRAVEKKTIIKWRDTTIFRNRAIKTEIIKEIPRTYTWWDKTRFYLSYVFIVIIVLYIVYFILKSKIW